MPADPIASPFTPQEVAELRRVAQQEAIVAVSCNTMNALLDHYEALRKVAEAAREYVSNEVDEDATALEALSEALRAAGIEQKEPTNG